MSAVAERIDWADVTIASGASLSDSVNLGGRAPVALVMPDAWTTAVVTFQASLDGAIWREVQIVAEDGATAAEALAVPVAASLFVPLDANPFAGARFLRVRSGTSAAPVNQAAARIIQMVRREFW